MILSQESIFKPNAEFDFELTRNWEKRDSQKMIKHNLGGAKYEFEYDSNSLFQPENPGADDDLYGYNNTKACYSIIHQDDFRDDNLRQEDLSKIASQDEYDESAKEEELRRGMLEENKYDSPGFLEPAPEISLHNGPELFEE